MDNENEKRRLVGYHIWRKLSGMTDDELQSFSREIKDGADQHYTVWEMIEDAEHDARRDMIRDLTKRMVELSDIEPKNRLGVLFEREPEIPTPWPHRHDAHVIEAGRTANRVKLGGGGAR
jgi:hypothetical protein